jgi:hypothetical protein
MSRFYAFTKQLYWFSGYDYCDNYVVLSSKLIPDVFAKLSVDLPIVESPTEELDGIPSTLPMEKLGS